MKNTGSLGPKRLEMGVCFSLVEVREYSRVCKNLPRMNIQVLIVNLAVKRKEVAELDMTE